MKTYIINLKKSLKRKSYMEELLRSYQDFLDVHFIEAIDGKKMSKEQQSDLWNQKQHIRLTVVI